MTQHESIVLLCRHCGNRTPHEVRLRYSATQVYDYFDDEPILDKHEYYIASCGTCNGLTLTGGFHNDAGTADPRANDLPVLYPPGPDIVPPRHTLADPSSPIPEEVARVYRDAWPLRHTAPGAFANQIRRALEFVCKDRGAAGRTLKEQLTDLAKRNVFPPELVEIADLVREVGNRGSHADAKEVDIWDAELVDELFKTLLRFIYLGPSHAKRMRQRLSM